MSRNAVLEAKGPKRMLGWGIDCLGDVTCDQLGLMAS